MYSHTCDILQASQTSTFSEGNSLVVARSRIRAGECAFVYAAAAVRNCDVQNQLNIVQGCIKKSLMYHDQNRLTAIDTFLFITITNRNLFIFYTVDVERTF